MYDVDICLALIRHNFPEIAIRTVQPITRGWDSFVLDINDELIFRFPMRDDVIPYLNKERRLLPALEQKLSTPIPHFDYIGQGDASYPYFFVGYRKLRGIAFLGEQSMNSTQVDALAPVLATFLSELHRFPVIQAIQLGVEMHTPELWRERYYERYIDLQKRVYPLLDEDLCASTTQLWEDFLHNTAIFTFEPTLIHCDLVGEHILCDPGQARLTGVIDWGDATIGDPAIDFVGIYAEHSKAIVEHMLAHYQGHIDAAFWSRINFYLSYLPYSELLYGAYSERGDFIERGIAGLRTMFH